MARSLLSVLVTLTFGLTAVSVAEARDRIKVPSKGTITPEGWASVTFRYSCDPRPALTSLDVSVVETFGPERRVHYLQLRRRQPPAAHLRQQAPSANRRQRRRRQQLPARRRGI